MQSTETFFAGELQGPSQSLIDDWLFVENGLLFVLNVDRTCVNLDRLPTGSLFIVVVVFLQFVQITIVVLETKFMLLMIDSKRLF